MRTSTLAIAKALLAGDVSKSDIERIFTVLYDAAMSCDIAAENAAGTGPYTVLTEQSRLLTELADEIECAADRREKRRQASVPATPAEREALAECDGLLTLAQLRARR